MPILRVRYALAKRTPVANKRSASARKGAARTVNARGLAQSLINEVVLHQRHLDQALAYHAKAVNSLSDRDLSLVKALCFGCLRDWLPLLELMQHYLRKPIRNKERQLQVVLALGMFQLLSMRVPDHAALDQTVAVLDEIGKTWAKAMVNAVLRAVQRDRDANTLPALSSAPAKYKHPQWLLQRIQNDWPQQAEQIFAANNQQAAMDLRCNRRYWQRQQALQAFHDAAIEAQAIDGLDSGIRLGHALDVNAIPHFQQGGLSVQDAAAQLAAPLLALQSGHRVLDACAAPGGKTAHLLELQSDIELHAIDIEAARVALIHDNIRRLHLTGEHNVHRDSGNIRVETGDAANTASWWDGQGYDRILLDAPCSATGVIRRHPDIKLLRQAEDIQHLSQQQQRILAQMWPLLKSGGMLLYVTCSTLRQENDDVIAAFVDAHSDTVTLQALELPWGRATAFGWQILPGDNESDGFYYACLKKRETAS